MKLVLVGRELNSYIHCEKRLAIFPSLAGMSLPNSPWPRNNLAQGEFGSDILAGDGKQANLFLKCTYYIFILYYIYIILYLYYIYIYYIYIYIILYIYTKFYEKLCSAGIGERRVSHARARNVDQVCIIVRNGEPSRTLGLCAL